MLPGDTTSLSRKLRYRQTKLFPCSFKPPSWPFIKASSQLLGLSIGHGYEKSERLQNNLIYFDIVVFYIPLQSIKLLVLWLTSRYKVVWTSKHSWIFSVNYTDRQIFRILTNCQTKQGNLRKWNRKQFILDYHYRYFFDDLMK